jgi:hypothetical protein
VTRALMGEPVGRLAERLEKAPPASPVVGEEGSAGRLSQIGRLARHKDHEGNIDQ